ncbi:hypothetical protein NHX12_025279 [Muraenolepis orangiensis]|uniref:Uncharacterized protein n=1 Tax=Muraenolepis orangiensis TaxID=630683 RepID=A0A9Q0IRF4_9TELE|nr:hypothetical protein NHX12_025279 [Muraenolepis orangiensis]
MGRTRRTNTELQVHRRGNRTRTENMKENMKKENMKKENMKKENMKKENMKKENMKKENMKKENRGSTWMSLSASWFFCFSSTSWAASLAFRSSTWPTGRTKVTGQGSGDRGQGSEVRGQSN